MAEAQAIAEVFWRAFTSLPMEEKRAIVGRLLEDPRFREDLLDISLILARQGESSRPYEEFAQELRREGRL